MENNLIGVSGKIGCGKDIIGSIIQYLAGAKHNHNLELEDLDQRIAKAITEGRTNKSNIFEIKKFADKLKDTVCLLIGCTREELEDRDFKETPLGEEWWYYQIADNIILPRGYYPNQSDNDMCEERYLVKPTPRLFLQLIGTEAGRKIIHPNVWINATFADYKKVHGKREVSREACYDDQDGSYINDNITYENTLEYPNWVITDVRFPNEVQAIKDRGGIVIKIDRPMSERFPELWDKFVDGGRNPLILEEIFIDWLKDEDEDMYKKLTHASEISLNGYEDFDYVITNDGSILDLVLYMKKILYGVEVEA